MKVCASLSSPSDLDGCDTRMVEVRLDLLGSVPDAPGRDLLVTFRGPVDLGVLPEGFDGAIDIGEEPRPETSATVVASHHDFEGTPSAEEIASILGGMDCDVAKAAFTVRSFRDLANIMDAARSLRRRHVVLGMGQMGTITRVRADLLGNEFSFGYVGEPTAPGQLSASRMEELTDGCTVLGILGNPLSKSRSAAMQNAALREAGIPGIYLPFEAPDLDRAEDVVRGYGIRGLNVTIPYKREIMDRLDWVDPDAAAVGAVNTVVNDGGVLRGYNTDVAGIGAALGRAGFSADGRRVLVMGYGGAARACAHYMRTHGCDVTVTGRDRARGEEFASEFDARFRSPESVSVMMHDLVVNCTPVGMYSDGPYPVNISAIQSGQAIFDMTYGRETPLAGHAKATGCRFASGEDMLAGQGAESFRLWTGVDGMFGVMRGAI